MIRLHVPPARIEGDRARASPEDERYLARVLRLAPGDGLEVFDGAGGRWPAVWGGGTEIQLTGPRVAEVAGARPRLALWQGIGKGEKVEFAVQKATELGVAEVVPLVCRRSVVRLSGERLVSRLARWRKVAAEAARQCGRADVTAVAAPATVADLCGRAREGRVVVLDPAADAPGLAAVLSRAEPAVAALAIAVGPEGGFAPGELAALREAGAQFARLGRRALRTETAAVVVCAVWALVTGELD